MSSTQVSNFLPIRILRIVALVLAALVVLAACSSSGQSSNSSSSDPAIEVDPTEEDPEKPVQAEIEPAEVVLEQDLFLAGARATAHVYPLVSVGDYAVLTVDFRGLPPDEYVSWSAFQNDFADPARFMGVRLFDLENDRVYLPATDSSGKNIVPSEFKKRGEQRLQLAYELPDTDSIGLFLPGTSYIEEVPIVDGEPLPSDFDGAAYPLNLAEIAEANSYGLESFTRELADAVQTLTSTEEVVVTLGSDVLFDVDSDELTTDAAAAVQRAAEHLAGREPGTISVVGHTDDVLDKAYNQKLSERRAKAVAKELEKHIDTSLYSIETEGRGKTEPLVKNNSDENRAKNRRVTLTLESEVTNQIEIDKSGELPEFTDGPSATGSAGIEIGDETTTRHFKYTATAREVHEHLIVDLKISALDDAVDSSFGIGSLAGHFSYRGGDARAPGRTASGIQVMDGATRVYPLDHYYERHGIETEYWLPATDLNTLNRIDGGQHQIFSMIYPRLGASWDSITIRALGGLGVEPFELVDIPIERQ